MGIKGLRIEKEEMSQSLVSQNESQAKISNLTCQVEDLRELLELKKSNERRLDGELQKLEESMRHQSREKNQLFREKEQLQWRIKNKTSKSSSHSQSFSGVLDSSGCKGNFKTFNVLHSSVNPVLDDTHELLASSFSESFSLGTPSTGSRRPPSCSSTPSTKEKPRMTSLSYNVV